MEQVAALGVILRKVIFFTYIYPKVPGIIWSGQNTEILTCLSLPVITRTAHIHSLWLSGSQENIHA